MARFEGISILSENLTSNRLDADVGGKYWKKNIPKMTKLASFLHKISISASLLNFRSSTMAHFERVSNLSENWMGNRLDANISGKYRKKITPKMTKLPSFLYKMSVSASLLNLRSFTIACFEGISITSENFMSDRLDSNISGKY